MLRKQDKHVKSDTLTQRGRAWLSRKGGAQTRNVRRERGQRFGEEEEGRKAALPASNHSDGRAQERAGTAVKSEQGEVGALRDVQ